MNQDSVFCIAFSRLQADQMVQRLKGAAFSIHDISMLFAAGPMVAVLGDMACGLLNQGIPVLKARIYEDRVKEGRTLVSVQTESDDEMTLAKEIFIHAGGSDICTTKEPMQEYSPTPHLKQLSKASLSVA